MIRLPLELPANLRIGPLIDALRAAALDQDHELVLDPLRGLTLRPLPLLKNTTAAELPQETTS